MTRSRICLGFCLFGLLASASAADRPNKEPAALRFARRDAVRSAKHTAIEKAKVTPVQQKLAGVKKRIVNHKQLQKTTATKVQQLKKQIVTTAKDELTAQQALIDARLNIRRLEKQLQAAKRIALVVERQLRSVGERNSQLAKTRQSIEKQLLAAVKQNKADLASVKPLEKQLAAVKKVATAARQRSDEIQKRLTRLIKQPALANPKNARLVHKFKHDRIMWSCRFDETGEHILAGAQDKDFHRWDVATGSKIRMAGHRSWIRRFAFHPKSKTVVTGAYEGKLIWWTMTGNQPKPQRVVDAHDGFIRGVAISPDGQYVASGGNDNLVKIWSAKNGKLLKTIKAHKRHVYNVIFHPNGKHLVSGDLMGVIKQWQVGTWKHERDFDGSVLVGWDTKFQADCGGTRGFDFGPGGKTLAVAGISKVSNAFAGTGTPTVALFDWKTGKRTQVLTANPNSGHCWGLRWHHKGNFIVGVCGSGGGTLVFWQPGKKKEIHKIGLPNVAYDVALHPDGLRLAVALYDKSIAIYDLGPQPAKKKKK